MIYRLAFKKSALKEWKKLDDTIRQQFKKKLQERLVTPHVPSARLSGLDGAYKIKLRTLGYRLVYTVEDDILLVSVVTVGKREGDDVYHLASRRLVG